VLDRIRRAGAEGLTRIAGATPFVERARRPARSVEMPAAPPEPAPAAPAVPRAAPGHPPVTIGEIHVHVTEPAAAAADPLSLLAPYAQGLTARRDGAW
jgi:hypothetical protein